MNNENEIEKMAIAQTIRDVFVEWLNVAGCIPQGTTYWCECMGCIEDSAAELVNAGIGDKKQAIKEFAATLKERACAVMNSTFDRRLVVDIKQIDNLITKLYGADE